MSLEGNKLITSFSVQTGGNNYSYYNVEVGELIKPDGLSLSDVIIAVGDPAVRFKKKLEAMSDKTSVGMHFSFGSWKLSLKKGNITLSFNVKCKAVVYAIDRKFKGKPDKYDMDRAFPSWGGRPDSGTEPFWEVTSPITIRSRQESGGHKIVGEATDRKSLQRLLGTAEEVTTYASDFPEFIKFVEDGIVVGDIPKRNLPEMFKNKSDGVNKWMIRGIHHTRGYRNLTMLGFVHVLPGSLQLIPVTGGNHQPFFMIWGEIEKGGTYSSRGVIINKDASGYLPVLTKNGKQFVSDKLDKRMNSLTFSDQEMIKLAISDYIERL